MHVGGVVKETRRAAIVFAWLVSSSTPIIIVRANFPRKFAISEEKNIGLKFGQFNTPSVIKYVERKIKKFNVSSPKFGQKHLTF